MPQKPDNQNEIFRTKKYIEHLPVCFQKAQALVNLFIHYIFFGTSMCYWCLKTKIFHLVTDKTCKNPKSNTNFQAKIAFFFRTVEKMIKKCTFEGHIC